MTLQTDMLIGIEAGQARARHVLHEGEELYCALSWDEAVAAADERRGGQRPAERHHASSGVTGWLGRGSPTTSSVR